MNYQTTLTGAVEHGFKIIRNASRAQLDDHHDNAFVVSSRKV